MIYHVTDSVRWALSQTAGEHTGSTGDRDLAEEGFIHCSTAEQWPGVLERFYADDDDLLLLHIDEASLRSGVVYEQLGDATEPFPHVYGPIPISAVVAVQRLR